MLVRIRGNHIIWIRDAYIDEKKSEKKNQKCQLSFYSAIFVSERS